MMTRLNIHLKWQNKYQTKQHSMMGVTKKEDENSLLMMESTGGKNVDHHLENPVITKNKGKASIAHFTTVRSDSDNLPWVEKYRPSQLSDLVSHADIISTITKFIDQNKLPHMLFYGPPGTGKTSTILACARRLYGDKAYRGMILELNASDDRGISVVREEIKTFATTKNMYSFPFKLIILDEADAMTQVAQAALRRVMEKHTKNVRFCLICNYVGKIIPALQSRCTKFRFGPLVQEQIRSRLDHVIQQEGVRIDESGKNALLTLCNGDMRRVLNSLQACHAAFTDINEEVVYITTGSPLPADIEFISNLLFTADYSAAYEGISALKTEKGLALSDILTELANGLALMEIPPHVRAFLLDKLSTVEYDLHGGATENLQLGTVVGIYKLALEMTLMSAQNAA